MSRNANHEWLNGVRGAIERNAYYYDGRKTAHPNAPELKAPCKAAAKLRRRRFLIEHRHLILSGRACL